MKKRQGAKAGGAAAPIVLLTDFGAGSAYPAAMRGVILSIAPGATLVDLAHDVPPFSVVPAMYLLRSAYRYFPAGSIFIAVVDPGVGTERKAIGVRAGGFTFLGPDNGLLSFLRREAAIDEMVELTNRRFFLPDLSRTFHARDVFAPVAAHLLRGIPLARMGPPLGHIAGNGLPAAGRSRGGLRGEVIYIDRFGNVVTSVRLEDVAGLRTGGREPLVRFRGRRVGRILRTYGEGRVGEPMALVGSSGHLEIAVREGSAAEALGARVGDALWVRR